jgi:formate hydrogenlyase subunit 3/multisubunit Na+/H+ antiporter MnhD subunit
MNPTFAESFFIDTLLVFSAVSLPLFLALCLFFQKLRAQTLHLAPWAALPALLLSVWVEPGMIIRIPWLLLGAQFGVDATAQVFLLFTALLWTCAGVYARAYMIGDAHASRFFAFFLATMSGNIGLILAQDMITFYLFFALMSFAAYGLVIHDGSTEARRAGRVYLSLVIVGEVLLVPGLLLINQATGATEFQHLAAGVAKAPTRDLITMLILVGFGIKVGALPLHVWLPLAHPVAPTPASAVLSGAMIKAGLLGWLRFLPLGEVAQPGWGDLCMVAGLAAALYGVAVGLTQDNPKTVLAYSSISQMGFMTVGVGVGLSAPEVWSATLAAILLYALHHGLAKGALFLGVGIIRSAPQDGWRYWLIFAGLLIPALALAGAPLTSGAAAKLALKGVTGFSPIPWSTWVNGLLPLAAVGTTLLMGRFLFLLHSSAEAHGPRLTPLLWTPWVVLLVGVLSLSWFVTVDSVRETLVKTLSFPALWPVLVGSLLSWAAWQWRGKAKNRLLRIPPGDVLSRVSWLWSHCLQMIRPLNAWGARVRQGTQWRQKIRQRLLLQFFKLLPHLERKLSLWTSAGALFLALLTAAFSLLVFGSQ